MLIKRIRKTIGSITLSLIIPLMSFAMPIQAAVNSTESGNVQSSTQQNITVGTSVYGSTYTAPKLQSYALTVAPDANIYETNDVVFSLPANTIAGQLDMTLYGNTVVNLLGNIEDCEDTTKWIANSSIIDLDSSNKCFNNYSIKVTSNTQNHYSTMYIINNNTGIENDKYYFISSYIKNGTTQSGFVFAYGTSFNKFGTLVTDKNSFGRSGLKLNPNEVSKLTDIHVYFSTSSEGQYGFVDGVMINEISKDEYDNLTEEQLLKKHPFVNGIESIKNLRIKNIGKNLFNDDILTVKTISKAKVTNENISSLDTSRQEVSTAYYDTPIWLEKDVQYVISFPSGSISDNLVLISLIPWELNPLYDYNYYPATDGRIIEIGNNVNSYFTFTPSWTGKYRFGLYLAYNKSTTVFLLIQDFKLKKEV